MERISQIILRNADRIGSGKTLLINPPRDACFSRLAETGRAVGVFTQDFGDVNWLQASGAEASFGIIPPTDQALENIILVQPRERERLLMMLHALGAGMQAGAKLWLAGENRSGIKSSAKRLSLHFDTVTKVDNARHCTLFKASQPRLAQPFRLADYEKHWTVSAGEREIDLISLPGTFAHGNLDQGTSLLLQTLEELAPAGRVLDFACGSGAIGLALLSRDGALELTMLDISALAIESTRRSLRANDREATVQASDGLAELQGRYDWIISNPPFHRGIENDLEIARKFFGDARNYLEKTGKMLLVCNHHLPYPAWLRADFTHVKTIKTNRAFKVILASGIRG
jgi:16S rRNA (guanine1207-N2)-methyltransferase